MNTLQACPRCAKRLPTGVKFCRRCGLALTPRSLVVPLVVPPINRPPVQRPPVTVPQPSARPTRPERPAPVGVWAPAFLACLFCLAVIVVWFVCFSGAMDGPSPPAGPTISTPDSGASMPANPSYAPPVMRGPFPSPVQTSPPFPAKPGWGDPGPVLPTPGWPQVDPGSRGPVTVPQVPSVPPAHLRFVRPPFPRVPVRPPSPYDPSPFDGGTDRQNGRNRPNDW